MIRRIALPLIVLMIIGTVVALMLSRRPTCDPMDLVRRAYSANASINYTANVETRIFYCGHNYTTLSTIRHAGDSERIDYPGGASIISVPGSVSTYRPQEKRINVSKALDPQKKNRTIDLLMKNYRPVSAGTEHVAGRLSDIVDLVPRFTGNPSKRIWIDHETSVVLRVEDRTSRGELRSRTDFRDIRYQGNMPGTVFTRGECSSWRTVRESLPASQKDVAKIAGFLPSMPKYIPPGYVQDGIGIYDCGCACGRKSIAIRYTNGLNSISVYQVSSDNNCPMCRMQCSTGGACRIANADQAQVAIASAKDKSIIVVADLPTEQIKRIAESAK